MGSCAAPSAKGDDKFITTDYLQQCRCIYLDAGTTTLALARAILDRNDLQVVTNDFEITQLLIDAS
ncbi:hypothetical protein, partial [Acinetobacter baumannii]